MNRRRGLAFTAAVTTAAHLMIFVATDRWLRSLPVDAGAVAWSLGFYYENASRVMAGEVPYRDFVLEYPILTVPLFLAPRLLTANLATYRFLFVGEMLLFDAWAIVLIAADVARREGVGRVPGRLGWYTLYVAILCPLVIGRFELAPMACAFAAAHWWFTGRGALGGAAAGVGALMKVFPGVVAVPALIWEASRPGGDPVRGRGALAFFAMVAIGAAGWFALGGARLRDSIAYQAARGIEVESLYGGALLLAGKLGGRDAPIVFTFKAYHIAGDRGAWLPALSLAAQALALLVVGWRYRRSGMAEGVRYAGAAVLALVVTSKVLSPQFLIWLFPFLVVLDGPTGWLARRLFLLACLCTALIYPGPGFNQLLAHQAGAIFLLNFRNLLLAGLAAYLVFGPEGAAPGAADEA